MGTQGVQDRRPLNVSVQPDGEHLTVLLTDCRSISRHARGPFDSAHLQELAAVVRTGPGTPEAAAAAAALFAALFPGAVGQWLRQAPPGPLNLLIAPPLDALPWELAAADDEPLGERFAFSRQLVDDEAPMAEPLERPRVSRLRVLRLLAPGAACGEALEGERIALREVPSAGLMPDDLRALLAEHEVVQLTGIDQSLTGMLQEEAATWRAGPALFAIEAGPSERIAALARMACRLGTALLVHAATGPGGARGIDAVCRALSQACSIGEAVRQARRELSGAELRLYGDAAPVPVRRSLAAPAEDSLRQVTTLSFDLVDSTRLLQQLGSEHYSELLAGFHARCTGIVRRHGGVSDDPQGDDGIMSYFGFPVAHEAAPVHAVRAGLEIAAAVADLGVQVRVGIATGRVAIKAGQPVGVAIHLAARLQSLATPGTVALSQATQGLVRHRFALEPIAAAAMLKGIDGPQTVYRVLHALGPDAGDRPSDSLPRLTPFIGREYELALLADHWEASRGGARRAVFVCGEAGIGKSRLVHEFRRTLRHRAEDSLVLRCLPDGQASAFHALTEWMRRLIKLQAGEAPASQLEKIAAALPAALDAADAVPLLAALLSVPAGDGRAPPVGPPELQRERTLALLLAWFDERARLAPVCLVVEDVHWIDPSTREFLSRLVARTQAVPLLLLCTVRSEADPGWRPDSHEPMVLRGLSSQAARWLVEQACGEASLPPGLVRTLAARADGVPLFLEESARMAVELGATHARSEAPAPIDVPASLQDLLMARLDQLGNAKPVAQLGAVLGREFPAALLEAVLAHASTPQPIRDAPTQLALLERSGLLLRIEDPGGLRYAFRHALLRDTAYQSLWERDRQQVHRVLARVIAERFPALAERQPELLARHCAEAGLDAEALVHWEAAARRAAARSAHDEAISHLRSALAVLARRPADGERDATELRLQLLLASRYIATEGYGADQVERVYARAAQLCEARDDPNALLKVELGLEGYHFMRGNFARAGQIAERAAGMAERSHDPMHRMQADWALAHIRFHLGGAAAAVEQMDRCLVAYHQQQHRPSAVQDVGVMCLCYSAWGQWELGHADDALRRVRAVLRLAHDIDHKFSLGEAYGFAASVHHFRGETAAAMQCAERALAICEEGGFAVWLAHARVMHGRLLAENGDFDAGLAEMQDGYALWLRTGAMVTRPFYLALQAEGLALAGRPAEGLPLLAQALELIARNGERYHEAEIRRLTGELGLQDAARLGKDGNGAAERWLREAHALALRQGKRAFVLRSATGLARLWAMQGRGQEAAALLGPALAAVSEGLDTRDLRAARQALSALGQDAAVP